MSERGNAGKLDVAEYRELHVELPYTPEEIQAAIEGFGREVVKSGVGPGSLEGDDTAGLDYVVMTATAIREHLPKLWDAYTDTDRVSLVSALVGEAVTYKETDDGINLNYVRVGKRYELHVDSEPYTALVFVTALEENDGGKLVVYRRRSDTLPAAAFTPSTGRAILFDGSITPHGVTPTQKLRISMPLVYRPLRLGDEERQGTDGYLYGDKA